MRPIGSGRVAQTPDRHATGVEPTTIVAIRDCASAKNQAEAPSRNPTVAPTVNPRTGLLIRVTPLAIPITHCGEICTATAR